jgi:hypothetical protein
MATSEVLPTRGLEVARRGIWTYYLNVRYYNPSIRSIMQAICAKWKSSTKQLGIEYNLINEKAETRNPLRYSI